MGKQPVFKVAKIDDSLKFRAGAPKENVNLVDYDEAFGKMNHLSEYIYQQETEYFKKHGVKKNDNVASPEILGESKSMLPSPNFDDSPSELLTDSVTTHAKTMPPIPPPHLDHSLFLIKEIKALNVSQHRNLHHHHQNNINKNKILLNYGKNI